MRVLVTRPEDDARAMAEKLIAMGHTVVIAPLLDIVFFDGPEISLDGVQAILATSANGVRAIARRTQRRDVPLFAVGPQTAQEAERAGFAHIKNAQGDGAALARTTRDWAKPEAGALLHAASAEAPKHLASDLESHGYTVRREVLYEARAASALPENAATALRSRQIDAALFFSPRSAKTFAEGVARAGLANALAPVTACCISEATAKALAGMPFRAIRIADAPHQDALLSLLS
ncbi:MAG TPA: uroporphyrinogen-III synthase [Rhizomicrobium sp.]|nr:uroporphyrinogen-III synthase [Rhizomicrobium sp.]